MKAKVAFVVVLFSCVLLSSKLCAQVTHAPDPDAVRVADYCEALAKGNERGEALKGACRFALTVQQKLPNYICDERVERRDLEDRVKDVIDARVTFAGGEVTYSDIRVNGKTEKMLPPQGMLSKGEFGTQLAQLFAPENKAAFTFRKEVRLNSRTALLFSFRIRSEDNQSFRVWGLDGEERKPGYSGSLWLDKKTLRPVQLEMISTAVTSSRGKSRYMAARTEYGDVSLADGTIYLLPMRASLKACSNSDFCVRNNLEFRNCHKFRATARVVTGE